MLRISRHFGPLPRVLRRAPRGKGHFRALLLHGSRREPATLCRRSTAVMAAISCPTLSIGMKRRVYAIR